MPYQQEEDLKWKKNLKKVKKKYKICHCCKVRKVKDGNYWLCAECWERGENLGFLRVRKD